MQDAYFWIVFFGPLLFVIPITAYVFRLSTRNQYREAKQVIFTDDRKVDPRRWSPD